MNNNSSNKSLNENEGVLEEFLNSSMSFAINYLIRSAAAALGKPGKCVKRDAPNPSIAETERKHSHQSRFGSCTIV